ncbi:hypothetical protein SHKM778_24540 [Streptomyces sp. KM77-8]|uniref:Uncharacterized protein n=1 Tax=Streptomyces haneummycinicus TaxID=3074435 RepID=A0AAT9HFK2_9ACTN
MTSEQERTNKVRLTAKTVAPLTALALAAGAGALYYTTAGAHTPDTTRHAQAVNQPGSLAEVAQATVGNPDNPATWRLPIESYMPTTQQARLVFSTRDELIDRCMADGGYPQWKPAPDLPRSAEPP